MHTRFRRFALRAVSFAGLFGFALTTESPAFAQERYLPPNIPRSQGATPRPVPPPVSAPAGPTAAVTAPPAPESDAPTAGESLLRLFAPEEPARVGTPAASGTATSGAPTAGGSAPRFQPGVAGSRPSRGGSDPTSPGPDLKKLMGTGDEQRPAGPPPLPDVSLRARIFARGKPPLAIIEIGGKQLSVREGSVLQVPLGAGSAVQLQVVEVSSAGGVHIKVVDRDQVIILN